MSEVWIALGTAPLAKLRYEDVRAQYPRAKVVTCNGGIEIEPNPDIWVAVDRLAYEEKFYDDAVRLGSKALVIPRLEEKAHLEHLYTCLIADKLIPPPDGPYVLPEAQHLDPLTYETLRLSGLICVEYACKQEASEVFIVGMDGYPEDDPSHFHVQTYRRAIPVLVAKYPKTTFRVIGAPLWTKGMMQVS